MTKDEINQAREDWTTEPHVWGRKGDPRTFMNNKEIEQTKAACPECGEKVSKVCKCGHHRTVHVGLAEQSRCTQCHCDTFKAMTEERQPNIELRHDWKFLSDQTALCRRCGLHVPGASAPFHLHNCTGPKAPMIPPKMTCDEADDVKKEPNTELRAEEWLASRGLADLSLYWPHPKPIPQKDYPATEPQPTLQSLMADFAASIQAEAQQPEAEQPPKNRDEVVDSLQASCGKMSSELRHQDKQLKDARQRIEDLKRERNEAQDSLADAHREGMEAAAKIAESQIDSYNKAGQWIAEAIRKAAKK